jgi:hypothetical protein
MLRNKSIFQISTFICLSSISICNLLIDLRINMAHLPFRKVIVHFGLPNFWNLPTVRHSKEHKIL